MRLTIFGFCLLLLAWIPLILAAWRPAKRIDRALKRQKEEQRLRERRAWRVGKVVRV